MNAQIWLYVALTLLAGALLARMIVSRFQGGARIFFLAWTGILTVVFAVFMILLNQLITG